MTDTDMDPTDLDPTDLSTWMGKPPESSKQLRKPEEDEEVHSDGSGLEKSPNASPISEGSSSDGDILHNEGDQPQPRPRRRRISPRESSSYDSDGLLRKERRSGRNPGGHKGRLYESSSDDEESEAAAVAPRLQQSLYIDVPKLSHEDKQDYEFLPGHFSVRKVLSKSDEDRYLVQLDSGEVDLVSGSLRSPHI